MIRRGSVSNLGSPMRRISCAQILRRIANGELWSVFIDDTGPGGRSTTPQTLPPDRQTHVAAVFSPTAGAELMDQMPGLLEELLLMGGGEEFHFAHVYNGTGPYRNISIPARLGILEAFAEIAVQQRIRFLNQSYDSGSLPELRPHLSSLPAVRGLYDPRSQKDVSRILLLVKVSRFLESHSGPGRAAAVFIDEGWKRNGVAVRFPEPFFAEFLGRAVISARSQDVWGLQFADFAAFVLNRSQLLAGRDEFSALDIEFLRIAGRIAHLFDAVMVQAIEFEGDEADAAPDSSDATSEKV